MYRNIVKSKFYYYFIRKNKLTAVSVAILLLITIVSVLAPFIVPHDPNLINLSQKFLFPNSTNWFGTDALGRDFLSRIIIGMRVSLMISVSAVIFAGTIGIILGAISGYYGGIIDGLLLRVSEIFLCFPSIILIMTLISILGPNIFNLIILFGITNWAKLYRLIRSQYISLREKEFVEALRALSISDSSIIFRHILSNTLGPIVVWFTLTTATFIIQEAGLSFLGLGVQPPTPSLGNLLSKAQEVRIMRYYPWLWIMPGIVLSTITYCINFVGDAIRDVYDPRSSEY